MTVVRIDDPEDERLSDYRNIPDPELVERRGIFVAEGRLVVRRLLENTQWTTRSVMVTEAALPSLSDLVDSRPALPVFVVQQSVMNSVAGFNIHRGSLAIGERPPARAWQHIAVHATRLIALEAIGNADNVGAVFRAAAAFGVDGVLLGPSCTDPLYRKAIRTSMGAALAVPFARIEPWPDALRELGGRGWAVIAMTPSSRAQPLRETVSDVAGKPVMVVLGHEGNGLTQGALTACTHQSRIPIAHVVDSLNVGTAAAIALYELTR